MAAPSPSGAPHHLQGPDFQKNPGWIIRRMCLVGWFVFFFFTSRNFFKKPAKQLFSRRAVIFSHLAISLFDGRCRIHLLVRTAPRLTKRHPRSSIQAAFVSGTQPRAEPSRDVVVATSPPSAWSWMLTASATHPAGSLKVKEMISAS